jgi:hypothetical protein
MATAAMKRARRRASCAGADGGGRPSRDDVVRYPSKNGKPGRIDYRATEAKESTVAVVIGARKRQYGDVMVDTSSPLTGYSLGRMFQAGVFGGESEAAIEEAGHMLDAGNRMHDDFLRYYRSTGIMPPNPKAMDMNRVNGRGRDDDEGAKAASNRVMAIEGALASIDGQGRHVSQLTKRVILMDEDSTNWTPSMVSKLKTGLKALVDFYGIRPAGAFTRR